LGTQFEQDRDRLGAAIEKTDSASNRVRIGTPVFEVDLQRREWFAGEVKKIGRKATQDGRNGKAGRVRKSRVLQVEAGKDAHSPRPQAIGRRQRQSRGITAARLYFPNVIIGVIRRTQPKIGCKRQLQGIARAKRPGSHTCSIRVFERKVKGFLC
jgi:hypothetical protein